MAEGRGRPLRVFNSGFLSRNSTLKSAEEPRLFQPSGGHDSEKPATAPAPHLVAVHTTNVAALS